MNIFHEFGILYNNIVLARLSPGQEIILEAYVKKGKGIVHSKWSPVACCKIGMGDSNIGISGCSRMFFVESVGNMSPVRIVLFCCIEMVKSYTLHIKTLRA